MTLAINDYRYGLIGDQATREVLGELVTFVNKIQAGHVTSVDIAAPGIFEVTGGPVTGAGKITLSLALQAAGMAWMGPTIGANATPAFRALVKSDLPALGPSDVGAAPAFTAQAANIIWSGPAAGVNAFPTFRALVTADLPTAIAPTTFTLGAGTPLLKTVVYTPNLTPATVAANISAEQTFTVTGLTTGDTVEINPPGATAGIVVAGVRVSAANTLAITWGNLTAAPLTPTGGVYRVIAIRS